MRSPSCLTDPSIPLIVDTSAVINLIATGVAARILRALPMPVEVVDVIPAELETGRARGRPDADLFAELAAANLVQLVQLDERESAIFESLVIGSAVSTLDDGEAATIARAVGRAAIPIIDERKANRICQESYPGLQVGCTVDLLCHERVAAALGESDLAQAVLNALHLAHMRVLPQHVEWVVETIGPEQARLCRSLPRAARTIRHRPAQ